MSAEQKEKISRANLGKKRTDEQKLRFSRIRKRLFASGELQVWNKNKHDIYSFETRKRISDAAKEEWRTLPDDKKRKLVEIRRSTFKRMWANEEFYNKMYLVLKNNNSVMWRDREFVERQRAVHRALWKRADYVNNVKNGLKLKPNDIELYLDAVLQLNFEKQWMYTGDFQFWIEGKNPDFVNINGKLLIEYNGHPFSHTPERDKQKTEHYVRHGWKVLNLTQEDLKDEKGLITKINNFIVKNSVPIGKVDAI